MALTPKQKHRQQIRELKDREEFTYRLRKLTWTGNNDLLFRLTALQLFIPGGSKRALCNRVKVSIGETK